MNLIVSFIAQITLTAALAFLIVGYLRPYLRNILTDLCGTEERAQFWTAFSNILLIGMPLIISMNYRPEANTSEEMFFEIFRKLSGNLGGFIFALVCIGFTVTFFALFAPRTTKGETK